MKTPPEWQKLVDNNQLTDEIVASVLHSLNKRAKNHRDKAKDAAGMMHWRGYAPYAQKSRETALKKKEHYYSLKNYILTHYMQPVCVHRQNMGKPRVRIYDYEPAFHHLKDEDVLWSNSYFDHELGERVYFADVEDMSKPDRFAFFKYWEIDSQGFHSPIREEAVPPHLEVHDLPQDFYTHGEDIQNLVSVQFCNKVVDVVRYLDSAGMLPVKEGDGGCAH